MSDKTVILTNDPFSHHQIEKLFREQYITSKNELLRRIDAVINSIGNSCSQDNKSSEQSAFEKEKTTFVRSFRCEVEKTPLFEHLDKWWSYAFSISSQEAILYLLHTASIEICCDEDDKRLSKAETDAQFSLIKVKAPMMTAEEFAKSRGVASSTIRVWIRRGKLRSATKLGNTWMIPSLTEPFSRGYTPARYRNAVPIYDAPSKYDGLMLHSVGEILISQRKNERDKYGVSRLLEEELQIIEYVVSASEAEKLEAYLIAHPQFEFVGDEEYYE